MDKYDEYDGYRNRFLIVLSVFQILILETLLKSFEGDMSAMMGGGGDGSGMSQEQMQQMMAQMGGGGAVPPPPPDY